LDALPREEAPPGLAERTLARVEETREDSSVASKRLLISLAGMAVLGVVVVILLPTLARSREASRRASSQGNMKQIGLICKLYSSESKGERWPGLAPLDNTWAPDLSNVYGQFLTDTEVLVSPSNPDQDALRQSLETALAQPKPDIRALERVMGDSYAYLGYSIRDENDFKTLWKARQAHTLTDEGQTGSGPTAPVIPPLREGVERFLITDINNPAGSAQAQSLVPVLIEISAWKHKKSEREFKGANVLYMDGHVQFVGYGTFPVVKSILDALSGLEGK